MPGADTLYPPVQYGWGWLLLAFAILAAIILAVTLILVFTRPRRLVKQPLADSAAVLGQLRTEYLAEIDRVEHEAATGQLGARGAYAELSRLMRAFVNEYSGLEAPVLTLRDLVAAGVHPALVDALSRFTYPSVFGRGAPVDPVLGAQAARQVVNLWH